MSTIIPASNVEHVTGKQMTVNRCKQMTVNRY